MQIYIHIKLFSEKRQGAFITAVVFMSINTVSIRSKSILILNATISLAEKYQRCSQPCDAQKLVLNYKLAHKSNQLLCTSDKASICKSALFIQPDDDCAVRVCLPVSFMTIESPYGSHVFANA